MLEKELDIAKKAKQSIMNELHATKEDLKSEKARQLLEKQNSQQLQLRLRREAAANIAVRMELQSKRRESSRVEELENELKLERSASSVSKMEAAEYSAIRMELKSAKEKIQNMRHLEEGLKQEKMAAKEAHAEAKELTESLLATKYKDVESEKDRLISKLRRELRQAREMLKSERRKNTVPSSPARKKAPKPSSLSDWVAVAPTIGGLIPIIQPNPSMNMPPRIETSLPGGPPPQMPSSACAASTQPTSSEIPSLFHYEDDDASVLCDEELEPLHDELTFLRSAYDSDELIIDGNKVTHLIELATGHDTEMVSLALTVIIPENYPTSGVLGVKASIQSSSNCSRISHEIRKCALDSLPQLEEICMYEAKANEGREAIHPIFSVASGWANTDWHNILSKELSLSVNNTEAFNGISTEICVSLIHTHHLIESDRIQCVKKNASKLSLGGYIKIGKPGLILVEGTEADCEFLLEALAQSKKIFHSTTFKNGAKVKRTVKDIESSRCLPRKMEELESKSGMEELNSICEELGILQPLIDIISH